MIKSCEDIETLDEFEKWIGFRANALRMGLFETADIVCWGEGELMDPEVFTVLFEKELAKIKND